MFSSNMFRRQSRNEATPLTLFMVNVQPPYKGGYKTKHYHLLYMIQACSQDFFLLSAQMQ